MDKQQLEKAVQKDIDEIKGPSTPTSEQFDKMLQIGAKAAINRICLELAREGYSFEKTRNFKPL